MRRPTLIVFVKAPRPGRVKTRLALSLGWLEAAALYHRLVAGVLRRVADPRWRTVLALAPDAAVRRCRAWSCRARHGQGRGDIGARMARALDRHGPGPRVLVGGDIPELGRSQIAAAFGALGVADIVLGPAEDGGFYLVGTKGRTRLARAFMGVRWSHAATLADVLARIDGRRRVARIATLADLDTVGENGR
ncbi:MAG: glycosyltransferase [Alphaproteobacteria bacterium]|nr:glycosyltransferase [Alphaproteobacteria bacterium]